MMADNPVQNEIGPLYWESRWASKNTGWDLGVVSPPIKQYVSQLTDKSLSILIPGCGNAYEAEYLLKAGFQNITLIDISPTACDILKEKFKDADEITVICGDFFDLGNSYDLIIEQTFFCALPPTSRKDYVKKMSQLLNPNGQLVGVLFDREFEFDGPPFGGSKSQYEALFFSQFELLTFEKCTNSHEKREGTELFIRVAPSKMVL